jgi:gamma-glutamyltranspeptidase / glutathione hydrolase
MTFTTRPELRGTHGMVASTHWLASAVGMAALERGGNAFDAAVAAGLTLQVVEPHLNGPGGDLPVIFFSAREGEPRVLCAQGPAPAAATIERYRRRGRSLVPGTGLDAACVPGAFDGWMLLLRDHGTMRLADVLEPAIAYAEDGYPAVAQIGATIESARQLLEQWPASAELYLPPPRPGALFRNPALAATYRRVLEEARAGDRRAEIDRARDVWYRGFVAEAMHRFNSEGDGPLAYDDLAAFSAGFEAPLRHDFRGLTVCKAGPWSQGPVFLQQLALLDGFDLEAMGLGSDAYVHTVIECAKLAFADREAFYGDPRFVDVPIEWLLSDEYAAARRRLVGERASTELRPGGGRLPRVAVAGGGPVPIGAGEPTRGDTVHVDAVDRHGNVVAATPSGGWLQSSPVIRELGFPLGTRMQMFWLDEDHPSGLAPGRRPRTTLSPSLALRDGAPYLAFGTPGGDQQDQWTLTFLLAHAVFGLDLQAAIDAPAFHSEHFPSSFYPREAMPNVMLAEGRLGAATIAALRARGHEVSVEDDWSLGRVSAAGITPEGILVAAANPRGMQGYAAGR